MPLPPGQIFLLRTLPRLFGFPVVVYAALHYLANYVDAIPRWVAPMGAILIFPALFFVPTFWADFKNERLRRALDADPVPFVRGGGFLGLKILKMFLKHAEAMYPSSFYGDLPEKYGTFFHLRLLLRHTIVTMEPSHVKAILATQFDNFQKGPVLIKSFRPLLGDGIFNVNGDIWKFHRGLTRPFFARNRITDFDIFERHTDKAISVIRTRLREDQPVDFQDMIGRFTLDVASTFLLGKEMDSLSLPLPYPTSGGLKSSTIMNPNTHIAESFVHSFSLAQKISSTRHLNGGIWPLMEMWDDKLKPHMDVIYNFVEPVIQSAIERKKGGVDKGKEESLTMLDELVRQTDDLILIRDETINMLVAGKDTTSATLSFAVYMLSEHPQFLAKLRQEVLDTVGPNRTPTYDDVKDMKFLRAVINESLRLYPPVPFDARSAVKETTFPPITPGGKPLFIPAGATLMYSVAYMHRRKDLWGPDALEFDPDRFIDARVQKYLVPNPYIFLPFNAGPRICIGQQFAYNQMSFFLIRLLQSFSSISLDLTARPESTRPPEEWKLKEGRQGKETLMTDVHLTLFIKDAMFVRMTEATER
ncbi:cytochrome P450 monooxygenase pc-2 [Pluteus cervinus]|uniref:Cytochrome P450 monooxygenase pc-2 n=1 Tax=Pluteus cervinus TaxID=181527 RepID=A0ACD3B4W7_9AGAR|nr:cytochrome P450 monooxygenase pc-2 [Pluteus cervinus]